jgi:hypothetical protein
MPHKVVIIKIIIHWYVSWIRLLRRMNVANLSIRIYVLRWLLRILRMIRRWLSTWRLIRRIISIIFLNKFLIVSIKRLWRRQ